MLKKLYVVCGKVLSFFTVLVILFSGTLFISGFWGWKPLIVMSGSMEPSIPTGSLVMLDTRGSEAEIQDIITFYPNPEQKETLVTHRIVRVEEDGYVTKGDRNEQEDFLLVKREQIAGIYLFHIPKAGYAFAKLNRRFLIAAAFWLFLLNGIHILMQVLSEGT